MKGILNIIHKTIYQFIDVCEDDEEIPMSDKDKLLLEVNKAICNNLKVKALEQETVLDKVRDEIKKAVWEDVIFSSDGTDEVRISRLEPDDVFDIIDKYRAESEGKYGKV